MLSNKNKPRILKRFFDKVRKTSTCWLWTGAKQNSGYGRFWDGDKVTGAHQFSARLHMFIIDIPYGSIVMHKCDTPSCVNPEHLIIGTQKENLQDMYKKNRHRKLYTYAVGENSCNAKLSNAQAAELRKLYSTGNYTWVSVGKLFGISKGCAGKIIRHETYRK